MLRTELEQDTIHQPATQYLQVKSGRGTKTRSNPLKRIGIKLYGAQVTFGHRWEGSFLRLLLPTSLYLPACHSQSDRPTVHLIV